MEGVSWRLARRELVRVLRAGAEGSRLQLNSVVPTSDKLAAVASVFLSAFSASISPTTETVAAAVAVCFIVATCAFALKLARDSETTELKRRILSIASGYDASLGDWDKDKEPSPGTEWASLPAATALRHGSPLESIFSVFRGGCWHHIPLLLLVEGDIVALGAGDIAPADLIEMETDVGPRFFERGQAIEGRHKEKRPTFGSAAQVMGSCQDVVSCYRLLKTPLAECLERLSTTRRAPPRLRPLVDTQLAALDSSLAIAKLSLVLGALLAGALRLAAMEANHWMVVLVVEPSAAVIVVLFPSLPILVAVVELLATAQILFAATSAHGTTLERAQEFLRLVHRVSLQRLGATPNEALGLDSDDPLPLRYFRLVERLGAVTILSVVDEDVVSEDYRIVEAVYFKSPNSVANSATVLGLYNKSGTKIHFEDPVWFNFLPTLKPIGLCAFAASRYYSSGVSDRGKGKPYRESLFEHLGRQSPREDGTSMGSTVSGRDFPLVNLGTEMGMTVHDLNHFVEVLRVHHIETLTELDGSSDYLEESLWRGALRPKLTSVIIEDKRSGSLQILGRGDVEETLRACSEYFDGGCVSPLSAEDRKNIIDQLKTWKSANLEVTAFCYSPVPYEMGEPLRKAREMAQGDLYLVNGSLNGAVADAFVSLLTGTTDAKGAKISSLTQSQIFVGMVASRRPLFEKVQKDIKDSMDAGVRYVFFSRSNMQRSKAVAAKMGLETDWNCAISLRAFEDCEMPEWSKKAQMPCGIDAIREHVDNIDNVPLLVSMMTDSTPSTVKDMFRIYQDNTESVLCLGSSIDGSHFDLFQSADLSFLSRCLPAAQPLDSLPLGSPECLSQSDEWLNSRVVGISCAVALSRGREQAVSETLATVRVGRQIIANATQVIAFAVLVFASLGFTVLLALVSPVSNPPLITGTSVIFIGVVSTLCVGLPMLATPALPSILLQTPCKNEVEGRFEIHRFILYFVVRSLPTAIAAVLVQVWVYGVMVIQDHPSSASHCGPNRWQDVTWCRALYQNESVLPARQASSSFMMLFVMLSMCAQSASFIYRTKVPSCVVVQFLKKKINKP